MSTLVLALSPAVDERFAPEAAAGMVGQSIDLRHQGGTTVAEVIKAEVDEVGDLLLTVVEHEPGTDHLRHAGSRSDRPNVDRHIGP